MLTCSGLSDEEKAQHPEFVLKVLDFQQKQIAKDVDLDEDSDFSDSESEDEDEDGPPPNIPSRPPPPGGQQGQRPVAPPKPKPQQPPPGGQTNAGEVTLRDLICNEDPRKIYSDFVEIGKGFVFLACRSFWMLLVLFVCLFVFFCSLFHSSFSFFF